MLKRIIAFAFLIFNSGLIAQREEEPIDPLFTSAFNKYTQKRYKESYEDYTAYLRKIPTDKVALYNRGLCSYELTDYKTAIRDFKESVDLGRKTAEAYYMLGLSKY